MDLSELIKKSECLENESYYKKAFFWNDLVIPYKCKLEVSVGITEEKMVKSNDNYKVLWSPWEKRFVRFAVNRKDIPIKYKFHPMFRKMFYKKGDLIYIDLEDDKFGFHQGLWISSIESFWCNSLTKNVLYYMKVKDLSLNYLSNKEKCNE
jgi:hypothetical protein